MAKKRLRMKAYWEIQADRMTRRGFCKWQGPEQKSAEVLQPWNIFIQTLKCERNKLELLC